MAKRTSMFEQLAEESLTRLREMTARDRETGGLSADDRAAISWALMQIDRLTRYNSDLARWCERRHRTIYQLRQELEKARECHRDAMR